jgi:hypothetical protein
MACPHNVILVDERAVYDVLQAVSTLIDAGREGTV